MGIVCLPIERIPRREGMGWIPPKPPLFPFAINARGGFQAPECPIADGADVLHQANREAVVMVICVVAAILGAMFLL